MNFKETEGIPIGDLPPCILNIKVRRREVAHAAAAHAYQLAESEAQRPAAVRRPVFLVLNPEDYAKADYLTVAPDDEPAVSTPSGNDAASAVFEAEQLAVRLEASGRYFEVTTYEYLDAVVGKAYRPIVVIDRYDQFATQDGPQTHERVLNWAMDRSGLVLAIRWPRSAVRRRSA